MSPKTWAKSLFASKPARRPAPAGRTRLGLEQFGDRLVPSATAAVVGTTLEIDTGDGGATVRAMELFPGSVTVQSRGAQGSLNVSVPRAGLTAVIYRGGNGADSFENATSLPSTAYTGAGNDTLVGNRNSTAGNVFYGGAGNDTLVGGAGDDRLYGEWGFDNVTGGAGTDWAVSDQPFEPLTGVERFTRPTVWVTATTAGGVPTGDVQLTGSNWSNDNVRVRDAGGGVIEVVTDGLFGSQEVVARVPAAGQAVRFAGLAGDDTFTNHTSLRSEADGGAGTDTLSGGSGTDTFLGSPGGDVYSGGDGADVLDRRGHHGMFRDGSTADTTFDSVAGKTAGRLSPAELKAVGQLNTRLVGDRLYLTGPSGAGFALQANVWQVGSRYDGKLVYSTRSAVGFETAWGTATLPRVGNQWFQVVAASTPAAGVGSDPEFFYAGVPLTSQAAQNHPAVGTLFGQVRTQFESAVEANTDGDLTLPGVSWGVELGADVGDSAAPLNPAVPYLFATGQQGVSFAYENVGYSNAKRATLAYAPGDGTVYAGVTGLPVVSDFAIGVSTDGYLPFVPKRTPDGAPDPNIYGHFYLRGELEFDSVPVAVKLDTVLDLDADDDGTLAGGAFSQERVDQVLDTLRTRVASLDDLAGAAWPALMDVSIGANTGAALSFHGFSVDLAGATFWKTPTGVAFRASSSNPFEGVPVVGRLVTAGGYDYQGFHNTDGTWGMGVELKSQAVPGMPHAWARAHAGSHTQGWLNFDAGVTLFDVPHVGQATIGVVGAMDASGHYWLRGGLRVTNHVSIGIHLWRLSSDNTAHGGVWVDFSGIRFGI